MFLHRVPDTAQLWTPLVAALGLSPDGYLAPTMPRAMADDAAPRIDATMKRAILSLYRSTRDLSALSADFSGVAARGLVLWGAEDLFVPIRHAQRFCARWTIPLVYEPGVGHWGLFERPDVFARHLAAHWVRGGRAPGEAAR